MRIWPGFGRLYLRPMTHREIVKIAVRSVDGLLDREGSPLASPGIHSEVEREILLKTKTCDAKKKFRIEFEVPAADAGRTEEVRTALSRHFQHDGVEAEQELAELYRDARRSSAIGLAAALILVIFSELLINFGSYSLLVAIGRGLIILAWVALWHPADLFLYAHFPIRRRKRLAKSLSEAEVVLIPNNS